MAIRKLLLIAHVAVSVGWIGALVAYLSLDLTTAMSADAPRVRGAYVAMGIVTPWAILPLALATLATGVWVALASRWGLFRHYWVVLSLALTILGTLVLLVELRTVAMHADVASDPLATDAQVVALQSTLPHSIGGLVVLLVALVLNVVKPRGVTPYGWRKERERR
ncbi:MAG TPA: DUF2269 domain-containing protein [Candidatus Thermoplasmatota archaeon]|nr:DUF2269 domain-containing protein [Candidatus Thermoplasmatota archaeon]